MNDGGLGSRFDLFQPFNTFGTIGTFGTTGTSEPIRLALRPVLRRAALAGKISRRVDKPDM
jgi:hypothetical protein